MANPVLGNLTAQVTATKTVQGSATVLINGFATRLEAAIAKALENGATAEELAPVQAEVDALNASTAELSAAVEANTPNVPPEFQSRR